MPPAVTLERSLWTLNVLASILVVWRLYSIHVHHRYRFFFASMLLALARSAALFPFDPKTETYYRIWASTQPLRSEEHTSELQSRLHLVCRLLLEKKKKKKNNIHVAIQLKLLLDINI